MDDQVPFKVYTLWREGSNPEVRRFGVDKNVVSNYSYLFAKIQEVFPNLKEKQFSISWKDEDGDNVKMSSDEEVMTMLTALRETVVKLYVTVQKSAANPEPHVISLDFGIPHPEPNVLIPNVHVGVTCDGCRRPVVGFRYKCINCENFDLCGLCESHGVHSEHCVVRIPLASMSMQLKKEPVKKNRTIMRSFAITNLQDLPKTKKTDKKTCCSTDGITAFQAAFKQFEAKHAAAKERRDERREERQEKRQERQERQEKRREERQEERRDKREKSGEPRTGWMEFFNKYLDQFANLAADHVRQAQASTSEAGAYISAEAIKDMANKQIAVDPANLEKMVKVCLKLNNTSECPMKMLNREITKASDDPESSSEQEMQASAPAPQKSSPAQQESVDQESVQQESALQAPASAQAPTFQPANNIANEVPAASQASMNQQAMGVQAAPLNFGVDNIKPNSTYDGQSTSNAEVLTRDTSPDKTTEDWTMINKEKDMDVDNAAAGSANPALVENNLPKEFQARSGTSHGLIYPPLNTATAVYDPKDPVVNPAVADAGVAAHAKVAPTHVNFKDLYAQTRAGMSSASAGPAKPSAPVSEVRYHRVPHIDAAIRQMISMGFTNEGGWLTQLLESKDGNIASVLDLLTPVNPNRK